jgi:hypothetical protein
MSKSSANDFHLQNLVHEEKLPSLHCECPAMRITRPGYSLQGPP